MPQDLVNQVQSILNSILSVLQIIATFLVAFLVVFWLTLCFWTFRDIQSRTKDIVAQVFATLLVVFFNIPGVLLYILVRPKQTLAQVYDATLQEEYMLQDLEEREICPSCRVKTQPDFLFCYNCRTRLRHECPGCGQVIKLKWSNCPYCGAAQKVNSRELALDRLGLQPGRTGGRPPAVASADGQDGNSLTTSLPGKGEARASTGRLIQSPGVQSALIGLEDLDETVDYPAGADGQVKPVQAETKELNTSQVDPRQDKSLTRDGFSRYKNLNPQKKEGENN